MALVARQRCHHIGRTEVFQADDTLPVVFVLFEIEDARHFSKGGVSVLALNGILAIVWYVVTMAECIEDGAALEAGHHQEDDCDDQHTSHQEEPVVLDAAKNDAYSRV